MIVIDFCAFSWPVSTSGYECVDVEVAEGNQIRMVEPRWSDSYLRVREPLAEQTTLYREFADLQLTEDGILTFADEWGQLLTSIDYGDLADEDESGEAGLLEPALSSISLQPGDTVEHWFSQIRTMKALVRVWEVLEGDEENRLKDLLTVERYGASRSVLVAFHEFPDPQPACFVNEEDLPGMFQHLSKGRLHGFAKVALCQSINRHIQKSCSPWLGMDSQSGKPTILLTPEWLQAALWFQFADAVAGQKKLRQCPHCLRHFPGSERTNDRRSRKDKVWCSDACRVAACMNRRQSAIELHQQGKGPAQIARQLGVKVDSVRKWIKTKG